MSIVVHCRMLMVLIFFFVRSNLKQLLRNLNHQKNAIKKYGIWVDGKKYNISFTGNSRDKKARL